MMHELCSKVERELDWERTFDFEHGIIDTIDWYINNKKWIADIESGAYRDAYKELSLRKRNKRV